jgi:hypothetical protein
MIRRILALFSRSHGHVCLSEQRRALLRALAVHVGHARPDIASDIDCVNAIKHAIAALDDRASAAEQRADKLEQAWRDLLSMQLGAQVPASMLVDPEAVIRQFVLNRRAGGAQG